jgi:DNA end-binding protein Ku
MFTPGAEGDGGTSTPCEITEFVPIEGGRPVYFDKAYYLAPDKMGAKAFSSSARCAVKRCALGRWARAASGTS